jgi:hypothetical protein
VTDRYPFGYRRRFSNRDWMAFYPKLPPPARCKQRGPAKARQSTVLRLALVLRMHYAAATARPNSDRPLRSEQEIQFGLQGEESRARSRGASERRKS